MLNVFFPPFVVICFRALNYFLAYFLLMLMIFVHYFFILENLVGMPIFEEEL